ncbi:MAG: thymidylate kinase [Candidatus Curtissbacteria bacterium]|nr:thymidylate kinase [Candidatus Curtissbacteria bacterium]
MAKGKLIRRKAPLIVFEGADGSGKTTQSKLLVSHLEKSKIRNAYVSFPRYENSMWGQMVKRYLLGEFGGVDDVDPYFGSMLYAGDRLSFRNEMNKWLAGGRTVVANRYMQSNMAHMGAKLDNLSAQNKYIKWLEDLEYGENKIPKEDIVLFLHVPVSVSKKLMGGRSVDIHEKNLGYLRKVVTLYERIADSRKNWETVECTNNGKILPSLEIHKKVLEVLKRRKIVA